MTIQFNDETFRGAYTFKNSEWALKRFPFPFHEDSYMYSVNMEQHKGGPAGSIYEKRFDVDEHYLSEMRDRAEVLKEDPLRCQSLSHMTLAGWDLLELIMVSKSEDYPDMFELHRAQNTYIWPQFFVLLVFGPPFLGPPDLDPISCPNWAHLMY